MSDSRTEPAKSWRWPIRKPSVLTTSTSGRNISCWVWSRKDQASARKSTVVGIASIGFFYILTLFLGLGAMTTLGPITDNNMAAPLLARQFSEYLFAIISAVAFTTVLGTVSGLIMAASGAVAHDLMTNFMRLDMDPAPLMLGFILGPMLEENFRRAMLLSRGQFSAFVSRPISGL